MAEVTVGKKVFLIPDPSSPCDTWRVYFENLKSQVGKDNAKIIWLMTWEKNGSATCTTNADFNNFLKRNDIDVSSAATRAIADVSAIGGNLLGLGKTMSKMLSIGVPLVFASMLIVVILLLIKAAKKTDAVDIALLASGGAGQGALAAKHLTK
jgi:hypothetical protein